MYSNVYDNKFINIKELIDNSEFEKAYNALKSISENKDYKALLESYNFYRDDYRDRSYNYNRRRRSDLGGCCCCCCDDCCCCLGDDCCEDCMKLWCLDSCCECFGGDLVSCF